MTSNESRRTNTTMNNTIYYLPGHGGRLASGLGEALTARVTRAALGYLAPLQVAHIGPA